MMRNLLYTLVLSLAANFAVAQVELSPDELSLVATAAEGVDQIYHEFHVINNTGSEVNVYWTLELADNFPDEWTAQICDINLCYGWGTFKSSPNAPNVLADGADVKFSIKARRNDFAVMEGNTYAIIRLFDDPEFTNEIAVSSVPTVSTNDVDLSEVAIYPNPTTDLFQVKNDASISAISIYDIVGREVNRMSHSKGMAHDVSNLRTGMYLVRLEDANGKVVKAMRLSKR